MIVVQKLVTIWSKDSRSAEGARLRNSTPKTYPLQTLPERTLSGDSLVVDEVQFREEDGFEPKVQSLTFHDLSGKPFTSVGLVLRPGKVETVEVGFRWDSSVGAPQRPHAQVGSIALGEWCQLTFNGRFGWANGWAYHLVIYKVAVVESFSAGIFGTAEPHLKFTSLQDLR